MTKILPVLPRTAAPCPALLRGFGAVSILLLISTACLTPALTTTPTLVSPAAAPGKQELTKNLVLDIADPELPRPADQGGQEQENLTPPMSCARVTASDALHIRDAGSQSARVLGWFTQGTALKVLDDSGPWWQVSGSAIDSHGHRAPLTGFVHSNYVEKIPCEKR